MGKRGALFMVRRSLPCSGYDGRGYQAIPDRKTDGGRRSFARRAGRMEKGGSEEPVFQL